MRKANIVGAIVFMCLSIYVIAVTFTFKQFKNVPIGPEFFPRYLGIGMLICSIVLLVQSIKSNTKDPAPTLSLLDKGMQRLLVGIFMTVAYVLAWSKIGFLLITPIFLFGMMYLLKIRKYAFMIIISLCVTIGIFLVFKMILGIEMPMGLLEGKLNF